MIMLFAFFLNSNAQVLEREYDYVFFENSLMPDYYFYSSVHYDGGSYIKNISGKLPLCEKQFFTPPNSLELNYNNGGGTWNAFVSFRTNRGQNFFKSKDYLSFWIYPRDMDSLQYPLVALRLEKRKRRTNELIEGKQSKRISINEYIDSTNKDGWKMVKIPLTHFDDYKFEPNQIVFSGTESMGSGKVYIDQLELIPKAKPSKLTDPKNIYAEAYELHVDISWEEIIDKGVKYIKIYRSEDGIIFQPIGIQTPFFNRYTDFTGETNTRYFYKISYIGHDYRESSSSNIVTAQTHSMSDEALMDMVQEASFRYYWEGAEPNSGLARENIPGRKNMIATGASGFGIMAIIVGAERGFISRDQAVERMQTILAFLEKSEKYHGAVSHFIDGPTGKTEPFFGERDNGGDLVETSFLFQGLLTARSYFDKENIKEKSIVKSITELWEAVEWNWYDKEKENKFLTWHWSPDKAWVIDHKLIGWNETMITYILAMASPTHSVPVSMYYNGWADQGEKGQNYRKAWGKTDHGSMYTNGNYYHGIKLDVGVAKGGPLFFAHYSYMGLDPHKVQDRYTNYFENNRNIAQINWRYCTENPNGNRGFDESFWGLTASDGPWGYHALEPVREKENGTLAPTGALASFPYTPEQSMAALKNMYRNHGQYLWGEYGFRDAVNLEENWCAKIFMGLNQAPVTVMIENHRTGLIWDLFMLNKEINSTLKKIKEYN
jgi:hypothetical protein